MTMPRVSDVAIFDKFVYDGNQSFAMYNEYLEGKATEEEIAIQLRRYATMRVRKAYMRKLRYAVCEDLIQSCMVEICVLIKKRNIPNKSAAVFHAFLNSVIRCKIAKTFKTIYDDSPKLMDPDTYIKEQFQRIPGSNEKETELFLDELPDSICKQITEDAHLRFRDTNEVDAVHYIMGRIREGKRIVEPLLRRKYLIKDVKFFIDHVKVRIRMALYEARQYIEYRKNEEKNEILAGGISECLSETTWEE